MQNSPRKVTECRELPTETNCTLSFSGEEEDVLEAAMRHVTTVHGFRNSPELRERLRSLLKDEAEAKLVNL